MTRPDRAFRALVGNVLLGSFSLLVGVLVAEGAVRLLAPQVTLFPRYVDSAEYPIEVRPNTQLVHAQGNRWRFRYTTNGDGRRGGPFPDPDSIDGTSVVLLGDSFTFGIGVQDDEVFGAVLARRLGSDVAVVNGGMSGWGLDSQIKWFYQAGQRFDPDVVVLQFTANDPTDDRGLTVVEDGAFRFRSFDADKPAWQKFLSRSFVIQSSHLYVLARTIYDTWSSSTPGRSTAEPDSIPDAEIRYVRLLSLFADRLRQRGIRLVVVSVTSRAQPGSVPDYDLHRFPTIQAEIDRLVAAGNTSFLELPLERFAQLPGSPEGHQWGSEHHRIVGEELAELIAALADAR